MALNIIIVDDDPVVVMIMEKIIARSGFHNNPINFENGLLALEYLKEHYSPNDTFIFFLDINMPVMNGWSFLDELSNEKNYNNVFVAMITSSVDPSEKLKSANYKRVIKYYEKPVKVEDLLDLKTFINEKGEDQLAI